MSSYGPGLRVLIAKNLKAICRENEARKSKWQGRDEQDEAHDHMKGLSVLGDVQEMPKVYKEGNRQQKEGRNPNTNAVLLKGGE